MDFMKKISNVTIRKASEIDADDWACILHASLVGTYAQYISQDYLKNNCNVEKLKEDFLQEINLCNRGENNSELYILVLNEVPVGILKIGQPIKCYTDGNNYYRDNIDGIGEIKSLHIESKCQGRGIGNQAIAFAEKRLRELHYRISHLWVKKANVKAIEFYKRMGYKETKFVNPNTNDKAPSIVMEKEIVKEQTKEENATVASVK